QRAGWYDTSTLRILDHMGIGFTVNNGYVWSQQSTPLRGWAELLGKALESYSLSRPYIKAIYTRTMGKVASKSARFWYSRPDWWRAIVAASNLRLWWLANATPYAAGISVDTLYIVTQGTPDLLPEVTKRLGDKPGQYRILWTKPLPPTVARLFGRIPATKLAEELARYGNL
ncbi:MAG: hypothetical protein ACTHMA_19280, partial [Thermomicrobiales bacterium]